MTSALRRSPTLSLPFEPRALAPTRSHRVAQTLHYLLREERTRARKSRAAPCHAGSDSWSDDALEKNAALCLRTQSCVFPGLNFPSQGLYSAPAACDLTPLTLLKEPPSRIAQRFPRSPACCSSSVCNHNNPPCSFARPSSVVPVPDFFRGHKCFSPE